MSSNEALTYLTPNFFGQVFNLASKMNLETGLAKPRYALRLVQKTRATLSTNHSKTEVTWYLRFPALRAISLVVFSFALIGFCDNFVSGLRILSEYAPYM